MRITTAIRPKQQALAIIIAIARSGNGAGATLLVETAEVTRDIGKLGARGVHPSIVSRLAAGPRLRSTCSSDVCFATGRGIGEDMRGLSSRQRGCHRAAVAL
jgi:hypothetical protein